MKVNQPQSVPSHEDASAALERVQRAKVRRMLKGGLATSAVAAIGVQGLAACATDDDTSSNAEAQTEYSPNVPAPGKTQGATEGQRNTDMVRYDGEFWTEKSDCNTRAGCMTLDLILKVYVKPVPSANLEQKRIGVVFKLPDWEPGRTATAIGEYFAANGGWEEWHVRIRMRQWDGNIVPAFTAWYKDGTGGVYYDDNMGEFHAADGFGRAIDSLWWGDDSTAIQVTGTGVTGHIGMQIADLDYDKEVDLIWTTDNWATANVYGMGGGQNQWHWVRDSYYGYDIWRIDLDIPGNFTTFQYAAVYKHGVVNGADTYEFWENNGGYNFTVTRDGTHPL